MTDNDQDQGNTGRDDTSSDTQSDWRQGGQSGQGGGQADQGGGQSDQGGPGGQSDQGGQEDSGQGV